jgi:hypothetical protein
MSAEGFFHDAHEVYYNAPVGRQWVATFATKALADGYVRWQDDRDSYEVVPV